MSGMCSQCKNDLAVPDLDLCRACEDDRVHLRRRMFELIQGAAHGCQFNHPQCAPAHPCGDCVEFASYGTGGEAA